MNFGLVRRKRIHFTTSGGILSSCQKWVEFLAASDYFARVVQVSFLGCCEFSVVSHFCRSATKNGGTGEGTRGGFLLIITLY